ncbi:MAG: alkaline shock response membrane anchor protein AmaP [Clostridia bacterium]|nr:alkaline shock response membrane anchor protein AmaP [Clostridia bacterium]
MKQAVRILSGFLAFLSVVCGVCLLLTAIGWPVSTERMQEILVGIRQFPSVLLLILCAIVLCAIGAFVLYGLVFARMNRRTSALIEKNALGETAVSFAALAQTADRVARSHQDVKSCKAKAYAIGNSVKIDVRVITAPTVSLLEMTHALQDTIAAAVKDLCGTEIGAVDVTVDQTET